VRVLNDYAAIPSSVKLKMRGGRRPCSVALKSVTIVTPVTTCVETRRLA